MRAAVLRGGQMVLRENVPEPEPGPGQVLVAVKARDICGSDRHLAKHGDEVAARHHASVLGDHEGDQHAVRIGRRPNRIREFLARD